MSSTEINTQACLGADFPADSEGSPVGSVQLQVRAGNQLQVERQSSVTDLEKRQEAFI